jgi:hypothetical protein
MAVKESFEIEIPESLSGISMAGSHFARKAPEMLTMLIMLGGFLWYLHDLENANQREDARMDKLADVRIQHCHDVQEAGIKTMDRLADALDSQARVFSELERSIEELARRIEDLEEEIKKTK